MFSVIRIIIIRGILLAWYSNGSLIDELEKDLNSIFCFSICFENRNLTRYILIITAYSINIMKLLIVDGAPYVLKALTGTLGAQRRVSFAYH